MTMMMETSSTPDFTGQRNDDLFSQVQALFDVILRARRMVSGFLSNPLAGQNFGEEGEGNRFRSPTKTRTDQAIVGLRVSRKLVRRLADRWKFENNVFPECNAR